MKYETDTQKVVVGARVKDGYEVLGYCTNIDGIGSYNVVIIKGRHRMAINALGYDSTFNPLTFKQEI